MATTAIMIFFISVDFDHTIYLWYQSTTLLQNFINLRQSAAKLLCKNPRWRPSF